jgi:hypothetical protein
LNQERREAHTAITRDDGRHTLARLACHVSMREQSPVVVSVHVNETRRDNATGGVDSPSCLKRQVASDGDDAVIADCHIRDKAGRPGAINDGAIDDNQVACSRHGRASVGEW